MDCTIVPAVIFVKNAMFLSACGCIAMALVFAFNYLIQRWFGNYV
jgi:hypothetical protein